MAKNLLDMDDDEITMVDLDGDEDIEHIEAEMLDSTDDFEEMTLAVQEKNKKALSNLKSKVMLSLDENKLKQAQKILFAAENIGEMFSDKQILDAVRRNTKTAMDMKFLSEAYGKLVDVQQKLMRLDSVDGQGNAARISLDIKFGGSEGNTVNTVIKAD